MHPGNIQVKITILEIEGDRLPTLFVTFSSPLAFEERPNLP
jgi:hypothetical protein